MSYRVKPRRKPAELEEWGELFQVRPREGECHPFLAQSPHTGLINVAMGDGRVQSVSRTTATWSAALTPNGNDLLDVEW